MQFKVSDYKDTRWIQLPVERYVAAPTLKQSVIAGVFKIKGASPWATTRGELKP